MEKEDVQKLLGKFFPMDVNKQIIDLWTQVFAVQYMLDRVYPHIEDKEKLQKELNEYVLEEVKKRFPHAGIQFEKDLPKKE